MWSDHQAGYRAVCSKQQRISHCRGQRPRAERRRRNDRSRENSKAIMIYRHGLTSCSMPCSDRIGRKRGDDENSEEHRGRRPWWLRKIALRSIARRTLNSDGRVLHDPTDPSTLIPTAMTNRRATCDCRQSHPIHHDKSRQRPTRAWPYVRALRTCRETKRARQDETFFEQPCTRSPGGEVNSMRS